MSSEFNINDLQLKYLELETLLDITNELNSFDQISVLLQEILVKSCAVLNASSGLILIEDDNSDVLHIGADFNIDISVLDSPNCSDKSCNRTRFTNNVLINFFKLSNDLYFEFNKRCSI